MNYEEIRYWGTKEIHVREKGSARTLCGKKTSSAPYRRKMTTVLQLGGGKSKKGYSGCSTCRAAYGRTLTSSELTEEEIWDLNN